MIIAVTRPRRYVTTGAAVAAATAVAVAPVVAPFPEALGLTAAGRAVQLAAEASIFNVPLNLIQDVINIPYNQVQATDLLARSLFFTGSWWSPSATNIWGEDPADPGHFMAVVDLLLPFAPQLSGLYDPELDPDALANGTAGLGQQLAMLAAALLPASSSCDAIQCWPLSPVDPITGITALDGILRFGQVFGGFPNDDNQLDLFKYWLKVPLDQLLHGYTFASGPDEIDNPTAAGIVNPDAGVGENGAVPDGFGFPGTVAGANGENLMPWAGLTFKLDPFGPFQQWLESLMQPMDLSVNGDDPSVGFHFVDGADVGQVLKALVAGMVVDFYPYIPGSPLCPNVCDAPPSTPPGGLTTLDLVNWIQSVGAPNPLIQQWIDLAEQGQANGSTVEQSMGAIEALQTGAFTFAPETQRAILDWLAGIDPWLPNLMVNSGVLTDPGFLGPWPVDPETGKVVPPGYDPELSLSEQQIGEYGGLNSTLMWDAFLHVIGGSDAASTSLGSDIWGDLASWFVL